MTASGRKSSTPSSRCSTRSGPRSRGTASRAAWPASPPAAIRCRQATLDSIRRNKLALKGPLTTPIGGGFRSVNVRLREEFQLYANLRPARTLVPGGRFDNIDLVLVRENLEGLYVAFEHYIPIGDDPHAVAMSSGVNTRDGSRRIVRYAFEHAVKHGRKKVTLVHKANVLKALTGVFLETGQQIAKEYAGRIECDERIVDACAMQLVLNPWQFDVIVTTNLFGDILSDLIAGLVGGLGAAPGANIGEKAAIFEAVHGSAPDIAGKGLANPTALLLAAGLMLDHVGLTEPRDAVAEGDRPRAEPGQGSHRRPGREGFDGRFRQGAGAAGRFRRLEHLRAGWKPRFSSRRRRSLHLRRVIWPPAQAAAWTAVRVQPVSRGKCIPRGDNRCRLYGDRRTRRCRRSGPPSRSPCRRSRRKCSHCMRISPCLLSRSLPVSDCVPRLSS